MDKIVFNPNNIYDYQFATFARCFRNVKELDISRYKLTKHGIKNLITIFSPLDSEVNLLTTYFNKLYDVT